MADPDGRERAGSEHSGAVAASCQRFGDLAGLAPHGGGYLGPEPLEAPDALPSAGQSLRAGIRGALTPGVAVLFASFLGFGALCRDTGLAVGHVVLLSAGMFALPGQVVLVDQIARDASLGAAMVATAVTAIRLLPMTVALMPYLRHGPRRLGLELALSHFVAITVWLESLRQLPAQPRERRVSYYLGLALTLSLASVFGAVLGYYIAGGVPRVVAAALLFLTPVYFALTLLAAARSAADRLALGLGAVLGPILFLYAPGADLLLTGLIGGGLAYLYDRHRRGLRWQR